MPYYRVNGLMVNLTFGGKARKNPPKPCVVPIEQHGKQVRCMGISTYLCDWPIESGGTCDAPLCEAHAHAIGPDRHLCPRHSQFKNAGARALV
jgi:hypothetical protein